MEDSGNSKDISGYCKPLASMAGWQTGQNHSEIKTNDGRQGCSFTLLYFDNNDSLCTIGYKHVHCGHTFKAKIREGSMCGDYKHTE